MSTEAYAYKSDFNSARDFRYRISFTSTQAAGGVAAQGNYVPTSAEQLDSAGTISISTEDISLAVERGNMRFGAIIAALSENENPVSIEPVDVTVDATGKIDPASTLVIAVEYSREPSGYTTTNTLTTGAAFVENAVINALNKPYTELRHTYFPSSDPSVKRQEITADPMVSPADYTITVDQPTGTNAGPY